MQYEYLVEQLSAAPEDELNALGRKGWKLLFKEYDRYLFMKELPEQTVNLATDYWGGAGPDCSTKRLATAKI